MASESVVLGGTGIRTSSLGLGCARLGSVLTPMGHGEWLELLRRVLSLGIRHFDSASVSAQGNSEQLIGRAVQGCRSEVCVATKAGQRLTATQTFAARFKTPLRFLAKHCSSVRARVAKQRQAGLNSCFEPGFLQRSLEQSLMRLRTDYVDIFYLHGPSVEVLGRDDVLWCLHRMQASGKARALGVSCESAEQVATCIRLEGISIVQTPLPTQQEHVEAFAVAAQCGKAILVRLGPPPAHIGSTGEITRTFQQRLCTMLDLRGVVGVIVGTTHLSHLEQDVAAWQSALTQRRL